MIPSTTNHMSDTEILALKRVKRTDFPRFQKYPVWYKIPAERWKHDPDGICERDSQRQKIYDASDYARRAISDLSNNFSSLADIQSFTNVLTSTIWFRKRFGVHAITVTTRHVDASANRWSSTIRFSKDWRNMLTVLHEIAHIARHSGTGAAHGRFFARTLIALVDHVVGKEAAEVLKTEFKKERVKYLPRRVLSKETKEKMRQNFINNVLKQKVGA